MDATRTIPGLLLNYYYTDDEVKNWSLTITGRKTAELYGKLLYDKNSIALDRNVRWMKQVLSLPEHKTKT